MDLVVSANNNEEVMVFPFVPPGTEFEDPWEYEEFKGIPNIEVVELPSSDGKVILTELMDFLAQRDLTSVLVEGGSEIHAGFLQAGLVDKVYAIIAPKIIGGSTAKSPVGDLGIDYMSAALQLEDLTVEKLQQDVLITGYLKRGE